MLTQAFSSSKNKSVIIVNQTRLKMAAIVHKWNRATQHYNTQYNYKKM